MSHLLGGNALLLRQSMDDSFVEIFRKYCCLWKLDSHRTVLGA